MGWHHIPDYDNSAACMVDNPFAGSRLKTTGKVSVKLPVDEWLCKKLENLNVTIPEGYPSRNSETSGLLRNQFVKTPRSSKWYDMHAVKKKDASTQAVCDWSPKPAKLNSMFSRLARRSLPSAPASRTFNQDTLRRWEKAFREQSVMCNHAAGLSRCLTKVQDSMVTQLKSLRLDSSKGKSAERTQQAVEELEYLCQPTTTVLPFGGTVSAVKQKCSRTGNKPDFTGVLQPAIFGTQIQQPVETYPGPEHLEHLSEHRVVQIGDPRDNKGLPTGRGVGHLHRLQGHILPHTNSQSVQEVHAFSHPGAVLPVQGPTLWSVHSTHGVHSCGQRGQTDGTSEGYKDPPVPRRLVGESHVPPNLSPAYTDLSSYIPRRKSGIYWIQVRRAAASAAAVEISLWTR